MHGSASLLLLAGAVPGDRPAGYLAEMAVQIDKRVERLVMTGLQVIHSDPGHFAQSLQTCAILGFAVFDETQPIAQDFAGILITA